jgi:hypothetical protein
MRVVRTILGLTGDILIFSLTAATTAVLAHITLNKILILLTRQYWLPLLHFCLPFMKDSCFFRRAVR